MKPPNSSRKGFTITELMVVVCIIGVSGGLIYMVMETSMKLYAKNSNINITHNQARTAYMQMVQDVHTAASGIICSGSTVSESVGYSSTGQGISFQVIRGGPFMVSSNVVNGATSIPIAITSTSNFWPVPGERLIIPSYNVEADIVSVTQSGTIATLGLSGSGSTYGLTGLTNQSGIPLSQAIVTSTGIYSYNVGCYVTDRVSYLVSGTSSTTGNDLVSWFAKVYPTGTGTFNSSYASLIGNSKNELLCIYHNLQTGALTSSRIAQGLINPTNLSQPLSPFRIYSNAYSSTITSTAVAFSNIATADTTHYSTIVSGSNLQVNGTKISGNGTALVFTTAQNSIGLNMCITGGTLQTFNTITTLP